MQNIPEIDPQIEFLSANNFQNVDIEHESVMLVKRRIEEYQGLEAPFVYSRESRVVTAPGTMFTFDELDTTIAPMREGSQPPKVAFAFHGNKELLNQENIQDDDVYRPSVEVKNAAVELVMAIKAVNGEVFPKDAKYIDDLVLHDFPLTGLVTGPEDFIQKVETALANRHRLGLTVPNEAQQKLNCAVVNTAEKIWLSAFAYKYLWGKGGENVELYLEDSDLSEGLPDTVYKVEFDEGDGPGRFDIKMEKQPNGISADYVFGCVDETAGTKVFVRDDNPHNAEYVCIGNRGNSAIEAFLDSGSENPLIPGFIALHYLHPYGEPVVITQSAKQRFKHLAQVIGGNNQEGIVNIVIQKDMIPHYADLIVGIKDDDQHHRIGGVKLNIVDGQGVLKKVMHRRLAA